MISWCPSPISISKSFENRKKTKLLKPSHPKPRLINSKKKLEERSNKVSLPPPSLPNYFKRQKRYVPIKIHGGAERLIHTSRKRQSRLSERSANYFQRQSRRKQAAAYNKLCRRFFDFSPSQTCHDLLFPLPARVRAWNFRERIFF